MRQLLLPFNLSDFAEVIGLTRNGLFLEERGLFPVQQGKLCECRQPERRFGPTPLRENRMPTQLSLPEMPIFLPGGIKENLFLLEKKFAH